LTVAHPKSEWNSDTMADQWELESDLVTLWTPSQLGYPHADVFNVDIANWFLSVYEQDLQESFIMPDLDGIVGDNVITRIYGEIITVLGIIISANFYGYKLQFFWDSAKQLETAFTYDSNVNRITETFDWSGLEITPAQRRTMQTKLFSYGDSWPYFGSILQIRKFRMFIEHSSPVQPFSENFCLNSKINLSDRKFVSVITLGKNLTSPIALTKSLKSPITTEVAIKSPIKLGINLVSGKKTGCDDG